jgi:hypothetical protein
LLLVALWVRSYYVLDQFSQVTSRSSWVGVSSIQGQLQFYSGSIVVPSLFTSGLESYDANSGYARSEVSDTAWWFSFNATGWAIYVPHWFLAVLCAALGVAPWIPRSRRFSLRMLLVGTTLVAVLLGLIVWAFHES